MFICNMERYVNDRPAGQRFVECGKIALWKHPHWPTGTYCEEHKQTLELFWPDQWSILEGEVQ